MLSFTERAPPSTWQSTLSWAPCRESPKASKESDMFQVFRAHISPVDPVCTSVRDATREKLRRATAACSDMQTLEHRIIHGWPPTKQQLPKQLQYFWNFRDELIIADSLILKSTRIVVPVSLRAETLVNHQSHRGPEYCLRYARESVFWPGKHMHHMCQVWKASRRRPHVIPSSTNPWQCVSQDLFELNQNYLVTVDHYSDFY
jgi:hypothetical protein